VSTARPIEELDSLPAGGFIEALAPLFEGAPGFLGRLAMDRPYGSWWNLLERARVIAQAMPEPEQVELLNAHPRLGAPPESVSELSYREQGYDRTPPGDAESRPAWGSAGSAGAAPIRAAGTPEGDTTRARLDRLNAAYEDWFGFRYCVFVAGHALEALIPELEAALLRPRDHELHRGIDAVVDIAAARSGTAR
jgi:2-oxo-4-hydroxy-4-carboxy--5-ureidoimidazoline (OHCU) decarboxylase